MLRWLNARRVPDVEGLPLEALLVLREQYRGKLRRKQVQRSKERYVEHRPRLLLTSKTPRSRYSKVKCRSRDLGESCLTFDEYLLFEGLPCHYCGGERETTGTGLDRKDSSKGYEVENVVPCCRDCNTAKSDRFSVEEMLLIGQVIARIKRNRSLKLVPEPLESRRG